MEAAQKKYRDYKDEEKAMKEYNDNIFSLWTGNDQARQSIRNKIQKKAGEDVKEQFRQITRHLISAGTMRHELQRSIKTAFSDKSHDHMPMRQFKAAGELLSAIRVIEAEEAKNEAKEAAIAKDKQDAEMEAKNETKKAAITEQTDNLQ